MNRLEQPSHGWIMAGTTSHNQIMVMQLNHEWMMPKLQQGAKPVHPLKSIYSWL